MRIVDVTEFYSLRGGGVRSHLTTKFQVLCQLGHAHRILAPGPHEGPEISSGATTAEQIRHENGVYFLRSPHLPYDSTYHLLYEPRRVRKLAKAFAPDVVEHHSPYVAALAGMRRTPGAIRTFLWHSDFIDTYARVFSSGKAPAPLLQRGLAPLWRWVRAFTTQMDATFCATRAQADKLTAHGVPRVRYLPFGVDLAQFSPEHADATTRTTLLRGNTGPLVLAIGRLAVEKRFDVVLEVFARIQLKSQGSTLIIVGDGPERARLEARARTIPNVYFAGFTKDRAALARMLASADLLLHGGP
jgi:alpha-1,6-mannosyltransferase